MLLGEKHWLSDTTDDIRYTEHFKIPAANLGIVLQQRQENVVR